MFDAAAQVVLHRGVPRITNDAAVPQSTWPPFEPTLIPADNVSVGNERRCGICQSLIVELARAESLRGQRRLAGVTRIIQTPIHVVHHEVARGAKNLMLDVQRGTERRPRI